MAQPHLVDTRRLIHHRDAGVLVGLLGQSPGIAVVLEYIRTERRQPSCRPVPSGSP